MTSLKESLGAQNPVIWVKTDEPSRATAELTLAASADRPVWRFDTLEGSLHVYDVQSRSFKPVLMHFDDARSIALSRLVTDAYLFAYLSRQTEGVLILPHAESDIAKANVASILFDYYFRMLSKQAPNLKFYVLADEDADLPEGYTRELMIIEHELPSRSMMKAFAEFRGIDKEVGEAAAGLTINEFASLIDTGKAVDAKEVYTAKRQILTNNSILEIEQPKYTLDDLGGLDYAKEIIYRVAKMWENPEIAAKHNVRPVRRILLLGVSGSGKSLLCEAVASTIDVELAKGGIGKAMNKWVGESEANTRRMFHALKAIAPVVFWVDEFGRDASEGMVTDGGTSNRVRGEFLTGLQELGDDVLMLAAANDISNLSPEMTRADRFDTKLFVGLPTHEERKEIFKIHLGDKHVIHDLDKLAEATVTFTGAEIKTLINETGFEISVDKDRDFTTDEIIERVDTQSSRIFTSQRDSLQEMYQVAMADFKWASRLQRAEAEKMMKYIEAGTAKLAPKKTFQIKHQTIGAANG